MSGWQLAVIFVKSSVELCSIAKSILIEKGLDDDDDFFSVLWQLLELASATSPQKLDWGISRRIMPSYFSILLSCHWKVETACLINSSLIHSLPWKNYVQTYQVINTNSGLSLRSYNIRGQCLWISSLKTHDLISTL